MDKRPFCAGRTAQRGLAVPGKYRANARCRERSCSGGLHKNMYKSLKSVLLELLNIEICAILYSVYLRERGT